MFGHKRGAGATLAEAAGLVTGTVAEVTDSVVAYVDPLAGDEAFRKRLAAAIVAGAAAQRRLRRLTGMTGTARRLTSDPLLRAQLVEVVSQLRAAQKRAKQARSRKLRNALFVLGGVGMVVGAFPAVRTRVRSGIGWRRLGWAPASSSFAARRATLTEEIEIGVPVSTAYNQWTQFEEFPRFMAGVDEVRQVDNTLLRWAVTVAGKRAEWEARIIEQEPDRLIAWESTDGKPTRGTVTFDEAGPGRSRIRLQMVYATEGVGEKVGAAIGLDNRRVRGDLERFRQLIENRRVESGGWRGQINDGVVEIPGNTTSD